MMASNLPDLSNGEEATPISSEPCVLKSLQPESFESMQCNEEMATVIRVKRKRLDEPAEALLLACKKLKHDENFKGNNGMADIIQIEENVFHFATTLKSISPLDQNVKDKVKDAIVCRNKLKAIYGKNRKTGQPKHQRPSTEKKLAEGAKHTLKNIVHSHNPEASVGLQMNKLTSNVQPSPSAVTWLPAKVMSRPSAKIKQTTADTTPAVGSEDTVKPNSNSDDIYCNSAKMIREKLNISEKMEDDYVYDIYYCQKTQPDWNIKDLLYVKPCRDLDFVYDLPEEEKDSAQYEDEDDSNDEGNWRNDYPDEEDSIDEDERRFIFDEEEDFYDSDDCDYNARDEDDAYDYFATSGGGGCDDGVVDNYEDFNYDDNNDPAVDQFGDYNNDQNNDRGNKDFC